MVARWNSMASGRSLRKRCLAVLGGLDLGSEVDVHDLCSQLSNQRGRPLRLLPFELPLSAPEGFMVSTDQEDIVVFEKRAVPLYQRHIILHEFGHLLFGHDTETLLVEDVIQLLMPSLAPSLVQRILGREHTNTMAEQEAELAGSLIGERISTWTSRRTWPVLPEDEELVERLIRALGQSRTQGRE
jgi:hypothetical protein